MYSAWIGNSVNNCSINDVPIHYKITDYVTEEEESTTKCILHDIYVYVYTCTQTYMNSVIIHGYSLTSAKRCSMPVQIPVSWRAPELNAIRSRCYTKP